MLIVHFPNRHQCGAWGREALVFDSTGAEREYPRYPDAATRRANRRYWLVEDERACREIPDTDGSRISSSTRRVCSESSYANTKATLPTYTPYRTYMRADGDWAQLSAIPESPQLPLPHQLLAFLNTERGTFDNDTHTKNEGNPYIGASEEQTASMDAWSNKLNVWLADVQLRAANEIRWSAGQERLAGDQ